ncbi:MULTISPECIES: RHS repeat domain-containing protein, partial [unclassified Myroides]|uniref:RHS repeat domain-containing protein n=1 Tax=unclassified Myroides TaxID=2642485 RepID=UPI003D2F7CAE
DYIGRPIQAYSEEGALVWSTDYDIYGKLRNLVGDRMFIPFRQLGQYEDIELDGLYYNRFRYYDSNSGLYIAKDPIGLAGNNPTFYAYVWDSNGEVDVFGLELITVGRWMGNNEFKEMSKTGKVIESYTGTTHVANPADIRAFGKQAKNGTLYVEFDVNKSSLKQTGENWASISGPNSVEGRLAKKKGLPIPEMPNVSNIKVIAEKIDGKVIYK